MTKLPNELYKLLAEDDTPDAVDLKDNFTIRHFVAFPTTFDLSELGEIDGISPLQCGNYHGEGRTSSSCFTLRNDIYFISSPSIFELNGGRSDAGMVVPMNSLGCITVNVFSVPLRTLTVLDSVFWNTTANTRKEFNISLFSQKHEVHNIRSWMYIANEDHNPEKYMNLFNAPEAPFFRETGNTKKKVYR